MKLGCSQLSAHESDWSVTLRLMIRRKLAFLKWEEDGKLNALTSARQHE